MGVINCALLSKWAIAVQRQDSNYAAMLWRETLFSQDAICFVFELHIE
jgi:hypothetical protein